MQSLYRNVVMTRDLSQKSKFSIVPTLTNGHEVWIMTQRLRLPIQEAKKIAFSDGWPASPLEIGVRSLVILERLERSQYFGSLDLCWNCFPHDPTLDKWLKMDGCIQYESNCTSKKVHVDMIFSYLCKKYC